MGRTLSLIASISRHPCSHPHSGSQVCGPTSSVLGGYRLRILCVALHSRYCSSDRSLLGTGYHTLHGWICVGSMVLASFGIRRLGNRSSRQRAIGWCACGGIDRHRLAHLPPMSVVSYFWKVLALWNSACYSAGPPVVC